MIAAYYATQTQTELAAVFPDRDAMFDVLDRLEYEAQTSERVLILSADDTDLQSVIDHYDVGPETGNQI